MAPKPQGGLLLALTWLLRYLVTPSFWRCFAMLTICSCSCDYKLRALCCWVQVVMVQEVFGHDGVVWAMRFSADARLLASGGRDGVLRVWSVYWGPAAAG